MWRPALCTLSRQNNSDPAKKLADRLVCQLFLFSGLEYQLHQQHIGRRAPHNGQEGVVLPFMESHNQCHGNGLRGPGSQRGKGHIFQAVHPSMAMVAAGRSPVPAAISSAPTYCMDPA